MEVSEWEVVVKLGSGKPQEAILALGNVIWLASHATRLS